MDLETILLQLGKYGKWQLMVYTLVCLAFNWPVTWQIFSITFMGAFPDAYYCKLDANMTLNQSAPLTGDPPVYDSCRQYRNRSFPDPDDTIPCPNGWDYEQIFDSSIVNEYSLVCDMELGALIAHTVMVGGALVGTLVLAPLSDVFGRKPIFLGSSWAMAAVGIITYWTPSYAVLLVFQAFRGCFIAGSISSALVIACELFPADQRVTAGTWVQAFWGTGLMTSAGWGYFFRDWRNFMLAISVPTFLTIVYIWIIPESVPYLVAKGKLEQAKAIIIKAAKMNKVMIDRKALESQETKDELELKTQYTSPLAIFYAPKMARFTWVMLYLWFAVNLAYWGLTLGSSNLGGDMYLNFFINGAVELPATFICLWALPRFGRRYTMCTFMLIGAAFLIAQTFSPSDIGGDVPILVITFAMLGKFAMSGVYLNLLFYAPEMFPTTHRNLGLGLCFVLGIIAGAAAPFIGTIAITVYWLPGMIFAVLAVAGAFLVLLLPETVDRALAQTIEETQKWEIQVTKEEKQDFKQTFKMKRQASQLSLLQAKLAGISPDGKDNPVFLPEEFIVSPASLSAKSNSSSNLQFTFDDDKANGYLAGYGSKTKRPSNQQNGTGPHSVPHMPASTPTVNPSADASRL